MPGIWLNLKVVIGYNSVCRVSDNFSSHHQRTVNSSEGIASLFFLELLCWTLNLMYPTILAKVLGAKEKDQWSTSERKGFYKQCAVILQECPMASASTFWHTSVKHRVRFSDSCRWPASTLQEWPATSASTPLVKCPRRFSGFLLFKNSIVLNQLLCLLHQVFKWWAQVARAELSGVKRSRLRWVTVS